MSNVAKLVTPSDGEANGFYLTLWLRLVQKSCRIGTFDRYIGSLDSTVLARSADKSAELIVLAKNGWPINRPWDYQPLKENNLCLSLLGLVHRSRNWTYWFSALKKCIYTYPVLWIGHGTASIHNQENMSIKEKCPCQTVNIEKDSQCQMKVCKKLTPCLMKGSKKNCSLGLKVDL